MGLSEQASRLSRCCALAALAAALVGALPASAPQASARKFVFFDPGANQYDLQGFSGAFSRFLERADAELSFQVVRDANVLGSLLRDEPVQFVMVPSEFLRTEGKALGLTPVAVPTVGGDPTYRKVLVDTGNTVDRSLVGKGVAASGMAGNRDHARLAAELSALGFAGARIVTVPKDIDALLALSFGQVDAALVTPVSLEVLRQVNPQVASNFRTLAETAKILRSPVCMVAGRATPAQVAALVKAINGMAGLPEGRELMRRLAIDGWTKPEGGSAR